MIEPYLTLIGLCIFAGAIFIAARNLKAFAIDLVNEQKADFSRWIDENTPKLIEQLSNQLSSKFGENIMERIGGKISGEVRLEKGLSEAMTTDIISGTNPLVGMALEAFPQAKKYLVKNPQALAQLLPLLQGFMKKKEGYSETGW